MRILMVNHEFTITGASLTFLRLAVHLQGEGHELSIFPANPAPGPIQARFLALGLPITTTAPVADYDFLIANTICTGNFIIHAAGQIKSLWIIHQSEVGLAVLARTPALGAAFRAATVIAFIMPFQHDLFRSYLHGLDPRKFHTIPNGIEIAANGIAHDLVPPKHKPWRILQVGTVEPRKRTEDVIQAVALSGLDAECIICGKIFVLGEEATAIAAHNPAAYRLLGETSEMETLAWIASADIIVHASASETQPLAVFEAAALARPLLLTDLPCYRDVFTHGREALMFPVGHVELLAHSINILANSRTMRKALGAAASRAVRTYTNAACYARYDLAVTQAREAVLF
jgi:glycosyltransferase involved in cell wall biosynthesis